MFLLAWIRNTYKVLSADASPPAIAFGAAFGLTAGCVPLSSGLFFVLLSLLLVFRVQITTAIVFWGVGSLIRVASPAMFYEIGHALLENDGLRGFWTTVLNWPVIAWLGLERYAILGGAFFGAVLGAVQFWPLMALVKAYRRWAHEKLSNNRFFRWLTNFWLVKVLKFVFIGR